MMKLNVTRRRMSSLWAKRPIIGDSRTGITPTGAEAYFDFTASPFRDEGGKVVSVIAEARRMGEDGTIMLGGRGDDYV